VTYVAPLYKPCLVICNTRAACRFCILDHGFGALSKLQFQCLNVDWNDTLFLRDLWIIAWIDEINLSSVYCKSSSSSSKWSYNSRWSPKYFFHLKSTGSYFCFKFEQIQNGGKKNLLPFFQASFKLS
jgi:hypothetical protein